MVVRALSAGIGLLFIIPLLQTIGINIIENQSITAKILVILGLLHIPLQLWSILLVYVLLLACTASIHFGEELMQSKCQEHYLHHLRTNTYQTLIQARWSFFTQRNTADFLHEITTQLERIKQSQFHLLYFLSQLILAVVYFGLSILVSWQMTLIASLIALILLACIKPLHKRTTQSGSQIVQQSQTLFQSFYEQLSAIKLIKSAHTEAQLLVTIRKKSQFLAEQTQHFTFLHATSKYFFALGTALIFSLLLYLAIDYYQLAPDTLLLLLVVFSRLMPLVSALQQIYQRLLHYLPSFKSFKNFYQDCLLCQEIEDHNESTPITFQEAIVFDKVSFNYPSKKSPSLIKQFSIHIKKNTTVALIGPSGSGKTTIADLMLGLLQPTAGTIFIDKQKLDTKVYEVWRRLVAYVPQDVFLFNASIAENLRLFCTDATEEHLWDVLGQVCATEFVANLENGLDTLIGDRGIRLSGGERQRIALARALLMKPQLLILDESTNALDKVTIQQIQQSIVNLRGKITIFIISHQAEIIEFVDQVISIPLKIKDTQNYASFA